MLDCTQYRGPRKEEVVTCASIGPRAGELAILRHVPDGVPRHFELLAEQREVVMAVGEARVAAQGGFVDLGRFLLALHVDQQYAEVVQKQRLAARCGDP